jgi:hypothetical protein
MFSALYDFCRDQGSIIGGLLALAAGYLVFRGTTRGADRQVVAAHAQTEALRQQNRDLRNEDRRRQAQSGIVATKLLASVLAIIRNDVGNLKHLLEQPRYAGTNRIVLPNYRQLTRQAQLWDGALAPCPAPCLSKFAAAARRRP